MGNESSKANNGGRPAAAASRPPARPAAAAAAGPSPSSRALAAAVSKGDRAEVGRLIRELNADPSAVAVTKGGLSALHVAAGRGDPSMVAALLRSPSAAAAMRAVSDGGFTPLHSAAYAGHAAAARVLAAAGAPLDARTNAGFTPLHTAAFEGHAEVCAALLDTGASLTAESHQGSTPLNIAAWQGHVETCRALVARGGSVMDRTHKQFTPLHSAAFQGHAAACTALVALGASLEAVTATGHTPLHYAALRKHGDVARALLEAGASPAARTKKGSTPAALARYAKDGATAALIEGWPPAGRAAAPAPAPAPAHAAPAASRASAVAGALHKAAAVADRADQAAGWASRETGSSAAAGVARALAHLPLFGSVFSALGAVADLASRVLANQDNCAALARRCASLEPTLREAEGAFPREGTEAQLQSLAAVLREVEGARDLVESFADASRLRRLFGSSSYRAQFHGRDAALTRAVADLAAAVSVGAAASGRRLEQYVDVSVAALRGELAAALERQRDGDARADEARALAEENARALEDMRGREALTARYLVRLARHLGLEPDESGHTVMGRPAARDGPPELSDEELAAVLEFARHDRRLGAGGFGDVYRGEFRGVPAAVKVARLPPGAAAAAEASRMLRDEVEAMRGLDTPRVVRLLGARTRGPDLVLVTELAAGGSLADALASDEARELGGGGLFPADVRLRLARHVAEGLAYMHARGVLHRDVKASNVLLTGEDPMAAKLCDLGLARAGGAVTVNPGAGTPQYMPPEVLLAGAAAAPLTPASDVYSFGVLLVELFLGRLPGQGQTLGQLQERARLAGDAGRVVLTPDDAAALPPPLADLVWRCTQADPAARPATEAVLDELRSLEAAGMW